MSLVTVPLADVAPATPRSRLLTLDIDGVVFDFLPGQALVLAPHGAQGGRPYSIACSPGRAAETGRLELLVAVEDDGSVGPLGPVPAPGSRVDIDGPLGTFVFPDAFTETHVLFVAGGTGIAPLRSMLDHALRVDRQQARIALLYSARRGDEFAFIAELRAHAEAGRIELQQTVTRDEGGGWSGGRGRIGRAHFASLLREPARTLCFVCGPRAMVAESIAALQSLGVPAASIRTEGWGGPPA